MKIEINPGDRQLAFLLVFSALVVAISAVAAYNAGGAGGSPAVMGHSVDEMDWTNPIPGNLLVSGNVGIGTTSPKSYAKLEVDTTGNKSIYTMDNANGGLLIGYLGPNIQGRTTSHGNSDLILNLWSGNVGIGEPIPSQKLDVAGQIHSTGDICTDQGGGTCLSTAGTGDITGVTAGTGLTGGGLSGNVTLNADTAYLQRRVSSSCAVGSSIRAISSTGTVTCEADDVGTASGAHLEIHDTTVTDGTLISIANALGPGGSLTIHDTSVTDGTLITIANALGPGGSLEIYDTSVTEGNLITIANNLS